MGVWVIQGVHIVKTRRLALLVPGLVLPAAAMVLIAGCGGGARQEFKVVLPRTGPVIVEDSPTQFVEVSDSLKMLGAESNSIVRVTFAPNVPDSRKGALATQLRKAGFVSVVYSMTLDGQPAKE